MAWSTLAWPCAGSCPLGTSAYIAVRFEYAKNGEAVSFALGEKWCWDGIQPVPPATCATTATDYTVTWVKEFRYDGARQRYAVYDYLPAALMQGFLSLSDVRWSHYNGHDVFSDQAQRNFEPGVARVEPAYLPQGPVGDADTMYYHTDHLGTTRLMSDSSGKAATGWHGATQDDVTPSVFTAFGEPITGPLNGSSDRYGYVGAHGYQAHDEMPFLHVGHRYYDPAIGRFLQRDPIGIEDTLNVYAYVSGRATSEIDPEGLGILDGNNRFHNWVACNFWMRVHRRNTLANMSNGRAYAEAIGLSAAGGLAIYYVGPYLVRARPMWMKNARGFEARITRNFRVGWHRFPHKGRIVNRPHYHRRPGIGRHRPWQKGF